MSKMDVHASSPAHVRERRNAAAVMRRSERVRPVHAARPQKTALKSCPHCGYGLSSRYRVGGAVHLRRNTRPPVVCAWTP